MESTIGAVFSCTEFSGSTSCVETLATDDVPMDEFCVLYRQRKGLPNLNVPSHSMKNSMCTDNCQPAMEPLMDQNVNQKEDSMIMNNNISVSETLRHRDSRFQRGEKRYLEDNTKGMTAGGPKSQQKLRTYHGNKLEADTKDTAMTTTNNTDTFLDGYIIPIGTVDKKEYTLKEGSSCPRLKTTTEKEYYRQSLASALQSTEQNKKGMDFLTELTTTPSSSTSLVYMLSMSQPQYQRSLPGRPDLTSPQLELGQEPDIVDTLQALPNEETMRNDTIQDGNTVASTVDSNTNNDDNRNNEVVCHSSYPVRNLRFADESEREETFMSWENGDSSELSEAGFFFTGDADIVRCFYCDVGIGGWNLTCDPWTEHARYSQHCPFLMIKNSQQWIDNIQANWVQVYKPKYPGYQQEDARQKSFVDKDWNQSHTSLSPVYLAEAGFFWTGDHVRCHYCDGILRENGSNDSPWLIHARTFPFCKFVLKAKGIDFIETYNNDELGIERPGHYLPVVAGPEGHVLQLTCVREFNIREERDPMWSSGVQSLLEIGYSKENIIGAIKIFISRKGRRDFHASDLMDICYEYEEALAENQRLRNQMLCKVCSTEEVKNIFLPCGHLICQQCATAPVTCSLCNSAITESTSEESHT